MWPCQPWGAQVYLFLRIGPLHRTMGGYTSMASGACVLVARAPAPLVPAAHTLALVVVPPFGYCGPTLGLCRRAALPTPPPPEDE